MYMYIYIYILSTVYISKSFIRRGRGLSMPCLPNSGFGMFGFGGGHDLTVPRRGLKLPHEI